MSILEANKNALEVDISLAKLNTRSPQMRSKINFLKDYWGLDRSPFDNVPNPALFYPSNIHQEALIRMCYAIEGKKGAAMLTGDIGSGKTTLSRILIQSLSETDYEVALINNPNFSRTEFLRELNYQLGIETTSLDRIDLLHSLNERLLKNFADGKNTVVVIDEAQVIENVAVFEELRLLLNFHLNESFLLTLIILGQPELRKQISQNCQLEQRIAVKYHLGPLDILDTAKYVLHRIKKCNTNSQIFTVEGLKTIYQYTNGVPRLINNLSDMCLLAGYLAGVKTIDSAIVENVIGDGVY